MSYAIRTLEARLERDEFHLSRLGPIPVLQENVESLKQAIAILKQHATNVPAAPPEFLRDYPNASD
jgi:hypothetical protein